MKITNLLLWLLLLTLLAACNDSDKYVAPARVLPAGEETTAFYVCSEGLFNLNNSTIAYYQFATKSLDTDYFLTKNHRGLGDTANDLELYGSKLYCVVNVSNKVEVIDANTGVVLKQLSFVDAQGVGRQPRSVDFFEGKAYVCSFDGTVAKIDTATLQIEGFVTCGRNPDGICVANRKLYVSNSGGLDFPNYDNTVSVIDIATFKEIKKITVEKNPAKIHSDSKGDVYVVSRGDYGATPYVLQRIDSRKDELVQTFNDINALNFTIQNDTAYIYNYDFSLNTSWIKVFDCISEKVVRDNFITDGTVINTPYGINVNPTNGDVYITDAYNFTVWGDLLCFGRNGKLKFKLTQIGLNPNATVFINKPKQ